MQFDFLLPGLLGAPKSHAIQRIAPALAKLLAQGSSIAKTSPSVEDWLAQRFGLPSTMQNPPFAAIALLGEGGYDPANNHSLRADPIHLSVNRDRVVLLDGSQLEISSEEAHSLCRSLQAHFASDGLVFHNPHPERWYIQSKDAIRLRTFPTNTVRGRSVTDYDLDGLDRTLWQGRLSEMQMLLHAHPINTTREENGRLPINGIWLWGAGTLTTNVQPTYSDIIASDILVAGFAALSRARFHDSKTFRWNSLRAPCHALIASNDLDNFAAYGEWDSWRDVLTMLETTYFVPALRALRTGMTKTVTIHVPDKVRGKRFTTTRFDLLKFWRRDRQMEESP